MKRTLALMGVIVLATAGLAYADHENDATCHVFVDVDANIAIESMAPYFNLGSIQTGIFTGLIPFRVDANTEQVMLSAGASGLYKGDDPDSVFVDPIPIYNPIDDPEAGIDIIPHLGNPVGGHTHRAIYEQPVIIDAFPGMQTETVTFESAQNNHFSQQVDLVVSWTQDDPEKPMGEYSGKVKMWAWVVE